MSGRKTVSRSSANHLIWTLSGILLAACGGGGGGGGVSLTGGTRLTTTGPTGEPRTTGLDGTATSINGDDENDPDHIITFEPLDDTTTPPPPPLEPLTVGPPAPPPGTDATVIVTMGPIRSAEVWVDANSDNAIDSTDGDLSLGLTNTLGSITLPAIHRGKNLIARLDGGDDTFAHLVPLNNAITGTWRGLGTTSDEVVISPITHYLAAHTDNNKQAVLDSIFGNSDNAARRITLDDVLNADNYNESTGGQKAFMVKSLAFALHLLAGDFRFATPGEPVNPTLNEKLQQLFAPYRDNTANPGDRSLEGSLANGTLKTAVGGIFDHLAARPVIDFGEADAARITGTEDIAIALADAVPGLLLATADGLTAAEMFFGFTDPLGQDSRQPGMAGIYLEDPELISTVTVPLAGGDAQKSLRIFVTGDDGRIFDITSDDAAQYLGTDSITPADAPDGFTFIAWEHIHRLVFKTDRDAHGTFEIDYHVSDGETRSRTAGTLEIIIAPVDDPARITMAIPGLIAGSTTPDGYLDPDGDIMLAGSFTGFISVADRETPPDGFTLALGTAGDSASFTIDTTDPDGVRLALSETATAKAVGESYHVNLIASIGDEIAAEETYHFIQAAEDFILPTDFA